MKKALPLVFAVLSLALAATVAVQIQQNSSMKSALRGAEKLLTDARAQMAEQAQELERLRAAQATYEAEAKALRSSLASAPAASESAGEAEAAVAGAEGQPERPAKGAPMMEQFAKMFKDPEMKKVMRTQQGFGVRMMYGDLAKELGLSPDTADQLNELLIDRQLSMSVQGVELMSGNADEKKMAEVSEAAKQSREDYDKQVANVLGAEGYAKFQDYERTLGDRMLLRQYTDQFAARGTPLADAQQKQLLSIMGEERMKLPASPLDPGSNDPAAQMKAMRSGEMMEKQLENQKQINARVLARASTVLSPEQVNALRTSQEQMLEMQQMGMKMSREMFGGGK